MLSFLSRGARTFGITNATHTARFRPMWGTIPLPLGRDYGKWGTIPLQPEKCPTSQRNPAPHRSGMLPHFKRNQCPTSTGIRSHFLQKPFRLLFDHCWIPREQGVTQAKRERHKSVSVR